jgi:MoaA/NifB/PqqE/SkfB family radical SAM enzyme
LQLKKFRRVYVEITGFCGLNCPFCPPKTRTSIKIPLDKFNTLCKQLHSLTNELSFHLLGDPLTLFDLESYLDIAQIYGLGVSITTAGVHIERHARLLKNHKAVRQINFSLNSFHGQNLSKNFSTYIGNILNFCMEVSVNCDRFVNMRLWNGSNERCDEQFREQAIGKIEDFFKVSICKNSKRIRVAPKVIVDFNDYFEWPSRLEQNQIKSGFCLGLSDHFGILSDGTVVPCCLDHAGCINLGNAFETDILSILSSSRAVDIMEGFAGGVAVEELCQKCSYRTRFL